MATLLVADEVQQAVGERRPVVALESTIFSHLGLPSPANGEALDRCIAAVRAAEAVPAVTAVLDGVLRVGVERDEHERILGPARKCAARDLPIAVTQGWEYGATTVSAALAIARHVGVEVFATGGIGGVHRGADITGDVSADLDAIARSGMVTVCAGAKAFLDLARTLEYLETAGVAVLGWRSEWFPAFYTRSSGLRVPHRVDTAREVADIYLNMMRTDDGLLLAVPIPEADALPEELLDTAVADALAECDRSGITGAAVTPFVLERIAAATEGRSVPANLALAEHNARVAGDVASALAAVRG